MKNALVRAFWVTYNEYKLKKEIAINLQITT